MRDVARAHVLAAETPTASGRYLISEPAAVPTAKQASEWLQACRFAAFDLNVSIALQDLCGSVMQVSLLTACAHRGSFSMERK